MLDACRAAYPPTAVPGCMDLSGWDPGAAACDFTNVTANDTRRVDLVFGIGYEDDIPKAKKVLTDIVAADDRVLKDPAPVIAVSELADSSVNFVVRPWVKSGDYWAARFDITEQVVDGSTVPLLIAASRSARPTTLTTACSSKGCTVNTAAVTAATYSPAPMRRTNR